jgi:hypothetical protein
MKTFKSFLLESQSIPRIAWSKSPNIGWWLDNDPVTFYHGTHERNIHGIYGSELRAPTSGPTAGYVSLALDPYTAFGYASMSGSGGESEFRGAGKKATTTPPNERAVLVLRIPKAYFLKKMVHQRGNVDEYRNRLTSKEEYLKAKKHGKSDHEYYMLTEIRLPTAVPAKYIIGYMKKG